VVPIAAVLLVLITASGNFQRWERYMFAGNLLIFPLAFISHDHVSSIARDLVVPGVKGGFSSDAAPLIIGIVGSSNGSPTRSARTRDEPLLHLVEPVPGHEQSRQRVARLPAVEEGLLDRARDHHLEVGVVEDEVRRLPTELETDALDPGGAEGADTRTRPHASGQRHHRDHRMGDERLADLRPAAADQVEHAGGTLLWERMASTAAQPNRGCRRRRRPELAAATPPGCRPRHPWEGTLGHPPAGRIAESIRSGSRPRLATLGSYGTRALLGGCFAALPNEGPIRRGPYVRSTQSIAFAGSRDGG
jgi:hypothetical protein